MCRRLTSLFVFFCCLYYYGFCDCFYIFDVGQGNCQLAVFKNKDETTKIGIMYDCGSFSSREHVKISALKQGDYHYIFKKRSSEYESLPAEEGYSEDNSLIQITIT